VPASNNGGKALPRLAQEAKQKAGAHRIGYTRKAQSVAVIHGKLSLHQETDVFDSGAVRFGNWDVRLSSFGVCRRGTRRMRTLLRL